jgi:hypothetical protein
MRTISATLFLLFYIYPLQAAQHPCAEGRVIIGTFAEFGRGSTFTLQGSPQKYVPAGIVIGPVGGDLPQISGQLRLYAGTARPDRPDRYDRVPVQLFRQGRWIQGELLEAGQALTFATSSRPACRRAMLEAEKQKTDEKGNYWRSRGIELGASELDRLSRKTGHFVVVYGKVQSVGDRTNWLYLNFGQNWAQDFTASVNKRIFRGDIDRLTLLQGRTVQVRGILEERQGPLIRVIDDIQIQIID